MSQWPTSPVSLVSAYGVRSLNGAPQGHWGVDLAGAAGMVVHAPESGRVVAVWDSVDTDADNTKADPPWSGYGPGGVQLIGASGRYHVLAHIHPSVANGAQVGEGDPVGTMATHVGASGPHVHWEVRTRQIDTPQTREANTTDPEVWLGVKSQGAPWWALAIAIYLAVR